LRIFGHQYFCLLSKMGSLSTTPNISTFQINSLLCGNPL
jgi:hypothetical protein